MNVDFNAPLRTFKGDELRDPRTDALICAKDIVCNSLASVIDADKEDKLALALLSQKIWASKESMDISPEDAVLIRKSIGNLPASLFAQLYTMLG